MSAVVCPGAELLPIAEYRGDNLAGSVADITKRAE
jgi:hypothetical protein